MSQTATVKFDRDRLYAEFKKRNLSAREVAVNMGYDAGYFASCAKRGLISLTASKMLQALYHINPEDYAPVEKPAQKEAVVDKPIQVQSAIDYEKLGRVIASAVYEAVSKAWNEPCKKEGE